MLDKFESPKLAINGFIGILGKTITKSSKYYFTNDWDTVCTELLSNENVSVFGIHDSDINPDNDIDLLNLDDGKMEQLLSKRQDKNHDPLIYKLVYNNEYPLYDNSLSIHRKVYDKANMDLYEIHLQVKRLNPNCKFVGIKTDCLVYSNITTEIETSDKWGGVKRVSNNNIPKIHECLINNERNRNNMN